MIKVLEKALPIDKQDPRISEAKPFINPMEELESSHANLKDPDQVLKIGKALHLEINEELIKSL